MTKLVIITDGVKLSKEVKAFHASLGKVAATGHALAVSAVWHAANSGRGEVLTQFYNGLTSALQGAFRAWVGHEEIGKGFLGYSNEKGFTVRKDTTEAREKFMANAENITRSFFEKDTNSNAGIGEFSAKDIVSRVTSMLNSALGDKSTLSQTERQWVIDLAKGAERTFKGVDGQDKLSKKILDIPTPAQAKAVAAGKKVRGTGIVAH